MPPAHAPRRLLAATAALGLTATAACHGAPPSRAPTPTLAAAGTVAVVAHRGFSFREPEHTAAAYDAAVGAGADYLEQDLQLTADGRLLVLHDETGARTLRGPGCEGAIRQGPAARWLACDAGSWFAARVPERAGAGGAGLRPLLLEDVLARYPSSRLYIETKAPEQAPGMEDSLAAILRRTGRADGVDVRGRPGVLLQSFSGASLARLAVVLPSVPRVHLLDRLPAGAALEPLLDSIARLAQGVGPNRQDVTAAFVAAAHARCLVVHPYTVNDEVEMRRLVAAGVDGMFSDRPDLLRQVVAGASPAPFPAACAGR